MTFLDLPAGESVFVDANIFVFHFEPHPKWGATCRQLLAQIEQGLLIGYNSTHVLGEVAHQLMTTEARSLQGWSRGKVTSRLRRQRGVIATFTRFRSAIDAILQSRVQVLTIPARILGRSTAISQQYDLLTNDALTVAVMQQHGLTNIASHDADFDRVPGLTRYAPG